MLSPDEICNALQIFLKCQHFNLNGEWGNTEEKQWLTDAECEKGLLLIMIARLVPAADSGCYLKRSLFAFDLEMKMSINII